MRKGDEKWQSARNAAVNFFLKEMLDVAGITPQQWQAAIQAMNAAAKNGDGLMAQAAAVHSATGLRCVVRFVGTYLHRSQIGGNGDPNYGLMVQGIPMRSPLGGQKFPFY